MRYAANGFWDRDSGRAGFGGQLGKRFGTPRVCYKNLVSQRGKATGQRAANLACADDANLHVFNPTDGSRKPRVKGSGAKGAPARRRLLDGNRIGRRKGVLEGFV
jgi:hypothetical protein